MQKTVWVTGASRGIGKAVAQLFAQSGYRVAVHYFRSEQQALALCEDWTRQGYTCLPVRGDVRDPAQVKAMLQRIETQWGRVDILVNNAGVAQQKLFTDLTAADWDEIFAVNVKGVFHCSQAVLPGMIRSQQGKIINISSIWGLTGASCEVHYSAAKAAVVGLTKALAKELGPSHIQVNCVAPGVIETDMNAQLSDEVQIALKDQTPLGRFGTGEDVAYLVRFLASEESDYVTGQIISPNGGFYI